jgi:hypothetical protein
MHEHLRRRADLRQSHRHCSRSRSRTESRISSGADTLYAAKDAEERHLCAHATNRISDHLLGSTRQSEIPVESLGEVEQPTLHIVFGLGRVKPKACTIRREGRFEGRIVAQIRFSPDAAHSFTTA